MILQRLQSIEVKEQMQLQTRSHSQNIGVYISLALQPIIKINSSMYKEKLNNFHP